MKLRPSFHQETDDVAGLLAAKTVKTFCRADIEAGVFRRETDTARGSSLPPTQLYVLADDGNNIRPVADLSDLAVRNQTQACVVFRRFWLVGQSGKTGSRAPATQQKTATPAAKPPEVWGFRMTVNDLDRGCRLAV